MTQATLTASQLAANDERFPEILENFLLDIKFDITQIDDIVLAIASHEVEQTEATRLEVVATAYRAQLPGIWKQIQAFKNLCQPYKDLLAEVIDNCTNAEIELQPQKQAIVSLGLPDELSYLSEFKDVSSKAVEDAIEILVEFGYKDHFVTKKYIDLRYAHIEKVRGTVIDGKALVESMAKTDEKLDNLKAVIATVTDTPQDIINAHKPAKQAKPPKAAKTPKAKPTLPMPTIADLAALEAMSRKDLMEATKGVNSNFVTGVRANAASVELKRVLAKHVLNTEYSEPVKVKTPKQAKVSKSKATEAIAIPEGLTFASVKAMKYRELQKLAGILRSNGKFEGNIGGKGATTEALLSGICKGLGFDVVHVPAASPSRKPLEGNAFRAKYCPNLAALATAA